MSRNDPLSRPLTLKSRGTAGQMRSSEGENLHVGCTHLSLVRTAAVEVQLPGLQAVTLEPNVM